MQLAETTTRPVPSRPPGADAHPARCGPDYRAVPFDAVSPCRCREAAVGEGGWPNAGLRRQPPGSCGGGGLMPRRDPALAAPLVFLAPGALLRLAEGWG